MDTIYDRPGLYERQELPETFWTDTLDAIVSKYDVQTAFDFGCGLGVDVAMMLQQGLDAYGVDGSEMLRECVLFPQERYMVRDLTDVLSLSADLIWCREVAEHIDEVYADRLVDNLITSANNAIYFTAAPPGQPGYQHINPKPRSYWQRLFRERDWQVDKPLTSANRRQHPNEDDRFNGMILCPK